MDLDARLFTTVPFCASQPDSVHQALANLATVLQRSAGSGILLAGDHDAAMYLVAAGLVRVSRTAANGREQVLAVLGPGNHFNSVALFDDGPIPASVDAVTDVTLLRLLTQPLNALLDANPALLRSLIGEFAAQMRAFVELIERLSLHSVPARLAALLLEQSAHPAGSTAAIPLTQAEMAARIGTVRETVGRALRQFEAAGLVRLERGAVVITDPVRLAREREA